MGGSAHDTDRIIKLVPSDPQLARPESNLILVTDVNPTLMQGGKGVGGYGHAMFLKIVHVRTKPQATGSAIRRISGSPGRNSPGAVCWGNGTQPRSVLGRGDQRV